MIARSRRILHKATNSYFDVISSVADAQHGANLHGAIVDELHVHPTPDLVEALETGTGVAVAATGRHHHTADDGRLDTIYARKRERIEKLARKVLTAESTYGVIWAATEADNPYSETTWQKANPGYCITNQGIPAAGGEGGRTVTSRPGQVPPAPPRRPDEARRPLHRPESLGPQRRPPHPGTRLGGA